MIPKGALEIEVTGERVWLLAERAVFRPAGKTLLVADLHLGKPASFRAAGLPVPESVMQADLERLTKTVESTGASKLVILGDLIHARSGQTPRTVEAFADWRNRHADLDVLLVRGNHDRHCKVVPPTWRLTLAEDRVVDGPFVYCHWPDACTEGYVLGGHVHPVAVMAGRGRQRVRLRCFVVGERRMILPAFGNFTGGASGGPAAGDRVFLVADDAVVEATRSPRST
jgi:uncharacterized protein